MGYQAPVTTVTPPSHTHTLLSQMYRTLSLFRHSSTTKTLFHSKSIQNYSFKRAFSQYSNSKRGRRWGRDEILALSTWLLVGTGAFVFVGTTTSASLALLLANSLQFQGTLPSFKIIFLC